MSLLIAPNYYPLFSCIADQCKHNCCIGWEIDLDPATFQRYQKMSSPFGERMAKAISLEGGTPHFQLDSDERCPFLASDGLCDIIQELGDDGLCEICQDHPRFRNYYSGATEIGLGLCCEEAARLILTQSEKVSLIFLNSNGGEAYNEAENTLLSFRNELIDIIQNRNLSLKERFEIICKRGQFSLIDPHSFGSILKETERLDDSFNQYLSAFALDQWPEINDQKWQISMEQLAVYFLYRHLPSALDDGYLQERIAFSLLSALAIFAIANHRMKDDFSIDLLIDTARMYSAEIEYSDQNIETILSHLTIT